jgi:PilZ domain
MDQLLTTLTSIWNQYWLLIVIGLTVAVLAFLIGRHILLAGGRDKKEPLPLDSFPDLDIHSTRDRRAANRRKGNPVEVELTDPKAQLGPFVAWVHDRSRGGIALHVNVDIPLGTVLNAKPRVRENTFTIPLEVRSSRPLPDGFLLGCQFVQMPPWNVLMLFG